MKKIVAHGTTKIEITKQFLVVLSQRFNSVWIMITDSNLTSPMMVPIDMTCPLIEIGHTKVGLKYRFLSLTAIVFNAEVGLRLEC